MLKIVKINLCKTAIKKINSINLSSLSDKEIENFDIEDTNHYPVMPLRNTVLFPQQVIPIYIGRDRSSKLINDLGTDKRYIVVIAQEDGSIEDPDSNDLSPVPKITI